MRVLILVLLSVVALACEPKSDTFSSSDDDDSGDADADSDSDGNDDTDGDDDDDFDTENCGEGSFEMVQVPVKLMILQDISGSMIFDDPANLIDGQTKWAVAQEALANMLQGFSGRNIEFGFDIFPDGSDTDGFCGVNDPVSVDCGIGTEQSIADFLPQLLIIEDFNTPLLSAMAKFTSTAYAPLFLNDDEAAKYLLVFSDGEDNCGGNETNLGEMTKRLLDEMGVKTFVIGFGNGVSPAELNAIASNGGTKFDTYLIADDKQKLEEALTLVANSVVKCEYDIEPPDEKYDPDKVNFYFDGDLLGQDIDCEKGVGWTWTDETETTVRFCEEACLELPSVDNISVVFGCPTIPVG